MKKIQQASVRDISMILNVLEVKKSFTFLSKELGFFIVLAPVLLGIIPLTKSAVGIRIFVL